MTMSAFVWLVIAVFLGGITLIAKSFLTSFSRESGRVVVALENAEELAKLTERGKNLATKEDIQEITKLQESVKTTFQVEMEQQKAEISRISKEYELYAVKKHEYYPELYKNIELCIERVKDFELRGRNLESPLDFLTFTKEDITVYIADKPFKPSEKDLILSTWENNRTLGVRDLEYILHRIEYSEVEKMHRTAERFYFSHRLYFSDEISVIANTLINNTYVLLFNLDPDSRFAVDPEYAAELREANEEINTEIDKFRLELFEKLQKELKTKNTNE
ncbi:conserved hypothetical protein [Bacillus mycoides]|uniref:Uncharacterized protein n=1 Tax=Bacillus mycoides TaxID=1405 RepID=A0A654ANM2_BACMY|nr:hypothetical protein [Bacillus mycoides]VXC69367.1 conserved hypothetical protein [Bacillus mycoides]